MKGLTKIKHSQGAFRAIRLSSAEHYFDLICYWIKAKALLLIFVKTEQESDH